jgi:hypothetical protein
MRLLTKIENEKLRIENTGFQHDPIFNFQFSILNFPRSAQKGTSAGVPGGGSQPSATALCALRPAYSLRHSPMLN